MEYNTSEICDIYLDQVDVVEPIFNSYGGRDSFAGIITTVKCFEDNQVLYNVLNEDGSGRVLLIDAGGSLRKAILDIDLVELASDNQWEGIVVYGCVRNVDEIQHLNIGIQALTSIPVLADNQGTGEIDVPVNFGGVTFLPEDYLYADNTGIILSPEVLDLE